MERGVLLPMCQLDFPVCLGLFLPLFASFPPSLDTTTFSFSFSQFWRYWFTIYYQHQHQHQCLSVCLPHRFCLLPVLCLLAGSGSARRLIEWWLWLWWLWWLWPQMGKEFSGGGGQAKVNTADTRFNIREYLFALFPSFSSSHLSSGLLLSLLINFARWPPPPSLPPAIIISAIGTLQLKYFCPGICLLAILTTKYHGVACCSRASVSLGSVAADCVPAESYIQQLYVQVHLFKGDAIFYDFFFSFSALYPFPPVPLDNSWATAAKLALTFSLFFCACFYWRAQFGGENGSNYDDQDDGDYLFLCSYFSFIFFFFFFLPSHSSFSHVRAPFDWGKRERERKNCRKATKPKIDRINSKSIILLPGCYCDAPAPLSVGQFLACLLAFLFGSRIVKSLSLSVSVCFSVLLVFFYFKSVCDW